MIVLDIETSGLAGNCGIWQICAINLDDAPNYFLQESRVDDDDLIQEGALKVTGKTREELLDVTKQSQKQMILNYFNWVRNQPEKIFFGQNVGWDICMIQDKCFKYGITDLFSEIHGLRGNDLHTLAQDKYYELHGRYFLNDKGRSNMSLPNILNFCGIPDKRIKLEKEKVVRAGTVHNAFEDCQLEGEVLYRFKFGKNFFSEYSKFEIPYYLRK